MANHFCTNSVEEQVNYLIDKVKCLNTNKLDKTAVVQETGAGTDVVMSQKAVTDAIANKGLDTLTDVNLTLGDTTVQYDTTEGIQINSTARFTDGSGNHDAMMDIAIPIVGTNGIIIDKVADSEKIEVSGKNLIKDPCPGVNNTGANIVNYKPYGSSDWGSAFVRNTHALVSNAESGAIVGYDNNGVIYAKTTSDDPWSVVNKEYAEENYVKKPEPYTVNALVGIHANGDIYTQIMDDQGSVPGAVAQIYTNDAGDTEPYSTGVLITNEPTQPYQCANKKYVDDAIASIPTTTTTTKYEHNLILEEPSEVSTFKAFISVMRENDEPISTLDDLIAILGSAPHSCTGYIYYGPQKNYTIVALDPNNPSLEYIDPDAGANSHPLTTD